MRIDQTSLPLDRTRDLRCESLDTTTVLLMRGTNHGHQDWVPVTISRCSAQLHSRQVTPALALKRDEIVLGAIPRRGSNLLEQTQVFFQRDVSDVLGARHAPGAE